LILTNKMLSVRSTNSESVNGANPYAFHLGQGTLFSYVTGNEYKDIMAAWDWNLVPGTTTQLNTPKLAGSNAGNSGKKDFVGVVSDGKVGTSVEDYVDPLDASFSYRKAWFYSDDSVLVVTSDIKSSGKELVEEVAAMLHEMPVAQMPDVQNAISWAREEVGLRDPMVPIVREAY